MAGPYNGRHDTMSRRSYIDWLRGIAVVSMIEWHVFDAWTAHSARDNAAWPVIKVIGGFACAPCL